MRSGAGRSGGTARGRRSGRRGRRRNFGRKNAALSTRRWPSGARNMASTNRCTFSTRIWLKNLFTLNFGESFKDNQPVWDKIAERLPVTVKLNFWSLLVVYLVAIPLGIYSATHQNSLGDQTTTLHRFRSFRRAVGLGGDDGARVSLRRRFLLSLSARRTDVARFVGELVLVAKFTDQAWHLFLTGGAAFLRRVRRACRATCVPACSKSCARILSQVARAKGLGEGVVVFKHVLRNSLIPQVTLLASILPGLIGGSVIIETIFSIPGLGQFGYRVGFGARLSRGDGAAYRERRVDLDRHPALGSFCWRGRSAHRLRPPGAVSKSTGHGIDKFVNTRDGDRTR